VAELAVGAWLSTGWATRDILAVAGEAEQAGYDSVWVADHFMANSGTAEVKTPTIHECFSLLAGLATVVPRVRLGTMVAGITYRHPAVLANVAGTIDNLSEGRLVLGVGAGWQLNEHAAYGIELGSIRERLDRFEEGLAVLSDETTTVDGKHYSVTDAPRVKVERPRVPILIGGTGEQRMLGIVARLADEWNCWSTPEVFAHKSAVLDEHCARVGRDPKEIHRTTQAIVTLDQEPGEGRHPVIGGSPAQIVDTIGRWRAAGLDELLLPTLGTPAEARELYARFTTEIRPQLDA
jgi:alkanesulfonate monooxygenase SsuD/methylene tetrahydromethanopterin reductase-like flavin-dependent oxidoreductase (luciferase family)